MCSYCKRIGLENLLTLGKSVKRTSNRQKDKILGNAVEALIAAIFLDSGLKTSKEIVLKVWKKHIDIVRDIEAHAKTALQELYNLRARTTNIQTNI